MLVDGAVLGPLGQLGVKDSKRLADASVERLAGKIRGCCIYAIVPIGPEKYNHLYSKIRNLNGLLAWGHARAIENILNREECSYALADQFGDENFLISALMSKGRTIQVKQQTRRDPSWKGIHHKVRKRKVEGSSQDPLQDNKIGTGRLATRRKGCRQSSTTQECR